VSEDISYKLRKVIRLNMAENDNISTWALNKHTAVRCILLWDIHACLSALGYTSISHLCHLSPVTKY